MKIPTELIVPYSNPGVTENVVAIEYHRHGNQFCAFSVKTRVTTEWAKVSGWRPPDKEFSESSHDYDFDWCKTNKTIYQHGSGGGGDWQKIHVAQFCEPVPPKAKLWLADGVRPVEYVNGGKKTRAVSDARLLKMGIIRIPHPLELTRFNVFRTDRTWNPFDVAEEGECHYCKHCDDMLPGGDGALCEHAGWCEICGWWTYRTDDGCVSLDSGDGKPRKHEEELVES